MKRFKNIISILGILILLLADSLIVSSLCNADVLPITYFVIVIIVLVLIDIGTALLFFLSPRRCVHGKRLIDQPHKTDKSKVRFIVGLVIVLLMAIIGVCSSAMIDKLDETLDEITSQAENDNLDYTSTKVLNYAVYVLADNSAQTLEDARGYTFAVSAVETAEINEQCITEVEKAGGWQIEAEKYDTVYSLVDSLYSGASGAIILNTVYDDVLNESEEFFGFLNLTKSIYEFSIVVKISEDENTGEPSETERTDQESTEPTLPEETVNRSSPYDVTEAPFVVYLSGSDSRSNTLTTGRSDVNLLLTVNPKTKQVLILNTPRDYYVANPAGNGAYDKLTHCGNYGINCSMEALADLYGIEIVYYARINFSGFETLIDAIGGIDVYSDVAFVAQEADHQIVEGMNHLDGYQALAFVRERHALAGGDNDRGKNQMKVITAIIDKLSFSTILMNYSDILDGMQDMFSTNMSRDEISELVKMQLADMASWNIQSFAVTGNGGNDITYSIPGMNVYVMYPDENSVEYASELIGRVMNGEELTAQDMEIQ